MAPLANVPADLIARLAQLPGVDRVCLDAQVTAPVTSSTLLGYAGENIAADAVWAAGFNGQGVVVGVRDSGVDPYHQDLASRWRGGANSCFDPTANMPHPTTPLLSPLAWRRRPSGSPKRASGGFA